jgi:hypothetical protein
MNNILVRVCGLFLIFSIGSCNYKSISSTRESFEQNRNKYEEIIIDVKKYRDKLQKNKQNIEKLQFYSKEVPKNILNQFHPSIVTSDPLVVSFTPDSIYSMLWYAETPKSVKFIFSYDEVVAKELDVVHLEGNWYLVIMDWN